MQKTRPTHPPPQTLRQAKRDYKKHGPRISSQEARQLARSAELHDRAEKIKVAERRRRKNVEKKKIKDERDRETRRRMGLQDPDNKKCFGLLSQRQTFLDRFMKTHTTAGEPSIDAEAGSNGHDQSTHVLEDDEINDDALLNLIPSTCQIAPEEPSLQFDEPLDAEVAFSENQNAHDENQELGNEDDLNDLFITNTQVEREISQPHPEQSPQPFSSHDDNGFPTLLSTQDLILTEDDLQEILASSQSFMINDQSLDDLRITIKQQSDRELMPPPPRPLTETVVMTERLGSFHYEANDFEMSSQDCRDIQV